ncbi:protein OBERON 4-like [Primulina huaijiensis]|uniref:protein OBERON 4-like n=1 Tax=Primulina huaijiensis TaxID=1492673 RepID=UPI003CC6FA8C
MKKLRSSEDVNSFGEKSAMKDWGKRDEDSALYRTSSSHRNTYYKSSDSGRKVVSRYERPDDDRESSRLVRKRSDYDSESYDRRKSYERHRDGNERGITSSSPRAGYGMDRMYRSESFCGPRREFPKGFRSERDRSRREGSVSSWRRFEGGKDGDDEIRNDGAEMGRGSRVESEEIGKARSPQGPRNTKSPVWSKDSGSEQSKGVEVKKSEDMPVESSGRSSEREEGELDPDPQPLVSLTNREIKDRDAATLNSSLKDLSDCVDTETWQGKASALYEEKIDASLVGGCEKLAESGLSNTVENVVNKTKEVPDSQDTYRAPRKTTRSVDENETIGENEHDSNKMENRRQDHFEEDVKSSPFLEQKEGKGGDLELQAVDPGTNGKVGFVERTEKPLTEDTTKSLKDKGKCLAILPSNSVGVTETDLEIENEPMDLAKCGDTGTEGTSTRGFQFFSTVPIKKQERVEQSSHNKPQDDKLALELSLGLPNVLFPIGSHSRVPAPGSPSHARSFQSFHSSFRTNSDGFTASMSFSGSQQFTHNPSCSLTHNAFDFEQSVGSKPLFQGVDWNALSVDENKNKDVPAYRGTSSRGNSLHGQSQISQGNSSGQAELQQLKIGKCSKLPLGLDRQLSSNKHLSGAQAGGSFENGPEYHRERRQLLPEKDGGGSLKINNYNPDEKDHGSIVGSDFTESVITMIVSEPIHTMAQKFNDMTGQHMALLMEFVSDIFLNQAKQWQLSALQKALRKRADFTLDSLTNAHRVQLEILVALKTGLREYLLPQYEIPSADLAEIFLHRRCRNITCRSLLPADECDCKICVNQNGFCRECMCLVCSKFDMASNTCSWVGCDVCLHWCHADCGLRESHIRNGRSATGAHGTMEMQFHCLACEHPSEMFGFVKEVFINFVKEWTAENLLRELEYVRRIFCASEDARGKKLHEIANQMSSKLLDGAALQDVQNQILTFFSENETLNTTSVSIEAGKNFSTRNQNISNGSAGLSQGTGWTKTIRPTKTAPLENSIHLLPDFDRKRNDKYSISMDLLKNTQKEPVFDELESIVKVKQAEANMFQTRADDARREAEALKRISTKKDEMIEEEYKSRIAKLRLSEAEEMQKQKMEELQALDRVYQEYFNMRIRMESDIKDLLLKMEATRRNLPT